MVVQLFKEEEYYYQIIFYPRNLEEIWYFGSFYLKDISQEKKNNSKMFYSAVAGILLLSVIGSVFGFDENYVGCGCNIQDANNTVTIYDCEHIVDESCVNYDWSKNNYCCQTNADCFKMDSKTTLIPGGFTRGKCLPFDTPVPCSVLSRILWTFFSFIV